MIGNRRRAAAAVCGVILVLAACQGESSSAPPPEAARAERIEPRTGDAQTATAGQAVAVAPSVRVTNAAGLPVAGAPVTFAVESGHGTLAGATQQTDAQGVATVGGWTLPTKVGSYRLAATVASLPPVAFTATARPGAAARVTVAAGDAQTGDVGRPLGAPLSVRVADTNDNPVPGEAVTFTVATGQGTLVNAVQRTDDQGIATVGAWVLPAAAGAYRLTATVGTLPPVGFTATARAGAAARLLLVSGDAQVGDVGETLGAPLTVRVTDAAGNPIAGEIVEWTIATGTTGGLSVGSSTSDASGIATVRWTLARTAGPQSVTARLRTAPDAAVTFSGSTGASIVGQVTRLGGPTWYVPTASTPAASTAARTSARTAQLAAGRRLAAANAAARAAVRTTGRLVVHYRAEQLRVPAASSVAYRLAGQAQTAAARMLAHAAPLRDAGTVGRVEVSPAILASRLELVDPSRADAVIAALRADPSVASVEREELTEFAASPPDEIVRRANASAAIVASRFASDPLATYHGWDYDMADIPQAWAITTGSSNVTVAVVDQGVRFDHPDLRGVFTNDGYDFVAPVRFNTPQAICGSSTTTLSDLTGDGNGVDPNAEDPLNYFLDDARNCYQLDNLGSHGTHVSGTIGALANNAEGIAGVNWNVRIRPVRVLNVLGSGTTFDVAQGILYAAGLPASNGAGGTVQAPSGVKVINVSLGGSADAPVRRDAVRAALAAGSLVIASSGNASTTALNYPAAYPEALSVSSVGADVLASYYSQVGKVDLTAPGGDFRSGGTTGGVVSSVWDFTRGQPAYAFYQGTSMAAPLTTGIAALLLAQTPSLTAEQLRDRLTRWAVDIGPPGHDAFYGAGVVNAYNSLTQSRGPAADVYVKVVDATTGATVRSVKANADGSFVVTKLENRPYVLVAGEDEDGDRVIGTPGHRFGFFGAGAPAAVTPSAGQVTTANLTIGLPLSSKPNNTIQTANTLVVGGYLAGTISTLGELEFFKVVIPTTGTYTIETSPVLGACGLAMEVDTSIDLLGGPNFTPHAQNDDSPRAGAGPFCSRVSTTLAAGTYYVRVGVSGKSTTNRIGRYLISARAGE